MSTDTTETQDAIDAGIALAEPQPLDDTKRFHVITQPQGGQARVVDLADYDGYLTRPRRKQGVTTVHDSASFIAYMTKHGLPDSEIYADVTTPMVVGVINAHRGTTMDPDLDEEIEGDAGFGDHQVHLQLHRTLAWKEWRAKDRKLLGQVDFAEHLEERLVDIVEPAAADLLELAQSFSAKRAVTFESSNRLSTGEVQLEYRETDVATGPRKGKLAWQERFALQLRLFEGGGATRVTGRLRYRIDSGQLRIGYLLDRPDDVERAAFDDVTAQIDKGTDAPMLAGTP